MTGVRIKPPRDINYDLVECIVSNTTKTEKYLIMVYIQEHLSDSDEVIMDSMIQ